MPPRKKIFLLFRTRDSGSLAACGEKRPSQEDVEHSIEAGTLTIEDALDKGWVDQAWVDAYYEENSVPAASKTESI